MSPSRDILVIPDSHVTPDSNMRLFDAAGKLIVDRQPDTIVHIGDLVTVQSFSPWDMRLPRKMENVRYQQEVDACVEAEKRLFAPLAAMQERQRSYKMKLYRPKRVITLGNHEFWVERWVDKYPQLEGFVDIRKNLQLDDFFDEIVPYRKYFCQDGISYTHVPMNKANQPVGGKYAAMRAAELFNSSVVFGHIHRWERAAVARHDSDHLAIALSTGCFFEGVPDYADGSPDDWWRGLAILHQYDYGRFDPEPISLERLLNEY